MAAARIIGERSATSLETRWLQIVTDSPPISAPTGCVPSAKKRYALFTRPSKLSGIISCLIDTVTTFHKIAKNISNAEKNQTISQWLESAVAINVTGIPRMVNLSIKDRPNFLITLAENTPPSVPPNATPVIKRPNVKTVVCKSS